MDSFHPAKYVLLSKFLLQNKVVEKYLECSIKPSSLPYLLDAVQRAVEKRLCIQLTIEELSEAIECIIRFSGPAVSSTPASGVETGTTLATPPGVVPHMPELKSPRADNIDTDPVSDIATSYTITPRIKEEAFPDLMSDLQEMLGQSVILISFDHTVPVNLSVRATPDFPALQTASESFQHIQNLSMEIVRRACQSRAQETPYSLDRHTQSTQDDFPRVPLWTNKDSKVHLANILHRFITQVAAAQGGLNLRTPWQLMGSSPTGSVLTAYSTPPGFKINKPAALRRSEEMRRALPIASAYMTARTASRPPNGNKVPLSQRGHRRLTLEEDGIEEVSPFTENFNTGHTLTLEEDGLEEIIPLLEQQEDTVTNENESLQTSIETGLYKAGGSYMARKDPSVSKSAIASSDEPLKGSTDMLIRCLICMDKLQAPFITSCCKISYCAACLKRWAEQQQTKDIDCPIRCPRVAGERISLVWNRVLWEIVGPSSASQHREEEALRSRGWKVM
ncbi:hypothetical protein VKT23_019120 [Stygiomarasmius scandens]|uniref:RING-type domain-containing protein n=1 Tax=Marasmiellus scandens TaxID=2682957 RepID=A0ABR1IPL7_9AGAR